MPNSCWITQITERHEHGIVDCPNLSKLLNSVAGCDPRSKEDRITAGDLNYIACWHPLKSSEGDIGAIGVVIPESQYYGPAG